jgi:hypothetical protein
VVELTDTVIVLLASRSFGFVERMCKKHTIDSGLSLGFQLANAEHRTGNVQRNRGQSLLLAMPAETLRRRMPTSKFGWEIQKQN